MRMEQGQERFKSLVKFLVTSNSFLRDVFPDILS